jgi:hypothetical protein
MGLLNKIKKKREELTTKAEELKYRGLERTEQIRAEKLRKKQQRAKYYEPGTIRYGLFYKQNPLDLMKEAKERRRQKREEKDG